ncbi:alpha/beta hydrolase [Phenylobacterium hankyongense]|uniref:Alpha/beta hydrolase n=1 Tax=Phenylobacterium hankyongense TaxID=1813876 RepID=A0A328AVF3_9CAUL|nr:alpha/beta hydrolase [Phenylobacterium hankyongense]RAK59050.1 alpha/beta hydrolase [Phenylobacterium hankyongense]
MADEAAPRGDTRETYDDRPVHTEPGQLPPEVQAPLAAYRGAEPPSPQWFKDAIAIEPERGFVESLGTQLEVLTWGEVGKPGLLFVHGNSAHADWWSFIAPFFAQDYRVASMSLAGMGDSGWRERYAFTDFAEDAEAVARATGLYEGGRKPTYIGHSFGGGQVFFAAARFPERMHAAILVDTGFGGPPPEELAARQKRMEEIRNIPTVDRPSRVYPTMEAALARFRLMPPQPAGNPNIADFIARRSLKRAPLEDGSGEGWTWKFDPNMWNKLDRSGMMPSAEGGPKIVTPMVHVFGQNSRILERRRAGQPSPFPPGMLEVEIPDAHHHIMIDQPLALVAALRALLAAWPDRPA